MDMLSLPKTNELKPSNMCWLLCILKVVWLFLSFENYGCSCYHQPRLISAWHSLSRSSVKSCIVAPVVIKSVSGQFPIRETLSKNELNKRQIATGLQQLYIYCNWWIWIWGLNHPKLCEWITIPRFRFLCSSILCGEVFNRLVGGFQPLSVNSLVSMDFNGTCL